MRGKFLLPVLALLLPAAAHADATTEAELRAALQQSTSQIANLENQVANLQAAEAPDNAMIEALKAQVQTLQKSGGAAPAGAAPAPANTKQLATLRHELAMDRAALDKTQGEYATATQDADQKAAANTRLTAEVTALNGQINSCDTKNAALFKLSNHILDVNSHKDDVFGVIANSEPFIGFSRVQLQNIVQDDQQTILDNQIAPTAP